MIFITQCGSFYARALFILYLFKNKIIFPTLGYRTKKLPIFKISMDVSTKNINFMILRRRMHVLALGCVHIKTLPSYSVAKCRQNKHKVLID